MRIYGVIFSVKLAVTRKTMCERFLDESDKNTFEEYDNFVAGVLFAGRSSSVQMKRKET